MEIGTEGWCAAMSEVLAEVDLPAVQATVEQRIGDGNGGPVVAYRLVIDGGRAHLEPVPPEASTTDGDGGGSDDDSDGDNNGVVVMSQSRETAEAVRRGDLGALAALQAGLIKVSGDVRVLIVASEALALVNTALGQALAAEGNGAGGIGGTDGADERGGTDGDGSTYGGTDNANGTDDGGSSGGTDGGEKG